MSKQDRAQEPNRAPPSIQDSNDTEIIATFTPSDQINTHYGTSTDRTRSAATGQISSSTGRAAMSRTHTPQPSARNFESAKTLSSSTQKTGAKSSVSSIQSSAAPSTKPIVRGSSLKPSTASLQPPSNQFNRSHQPSTSKSSFSSTQSSTPANTASTKPSVRSSSLKPSTASLQPPSSQFNRSHQPSTSKSSFSSTQSSSAPTTASKPSVRSSSFKPTTASWQSKVSECNGQSSATKTFYSSSGLGPNKSSASRSQDRSNVQSSAAKTLYSSSGFPSNQSSTSRVKDRSSVHSSASSGMGVLCGSFNKSSTGSDNRISSHRARYSGPVESFEEEMDLRSATVDDSAGASLASASVQKGTQKLVLVRHGERMDQTFPNWRRLAFTSGKYRPYDLNQPLQLPARVSADFEEDAPITEVGRMVSRMLGRALAAKHLTPTEIYSSPALRCIQTAQAILESSDSKLQIRVEPGLYDWMGWYDRPPRWMTTEQLHQHGFSIHKTYVPIISISDLHQKRGETIAELYQRLNDTATRLYGVHPAPSTVVLVAHSCALDACIRRMRKVETLVSRRELDKLANYYPFCAALVLQQTQNVWKLINDAIPPVSFLEFNNTISDRYAQENQSSQSRI